MLTSTSPASHVCVTIYYYTVVVFFWSLDFVLDSDINCIITLSTASLLNATRMGNGPWPNSILNLFSSS